MRKEASPSSHLCLEPNPAYFPSLRIWPKIRNFVFVCERAVRPVALGRANWHFSGSPDGAHSSCAMYTLLQSAKMNHLDPGAYLNHVLDEATLLVDLPYDEQAWSALLPWKFKSEDFSWQDRAEFFTSID